MLFANSQRSLFVVASTLVLGLSTVLGVPTSGSINPPAPVIAAPVHEFKRASGDTIYNAAPTVAPPTSAEEVISRLQSIRNGCAKNGNLYIRMLCQIKANILPTDNILTSLNKILMLPLDPVSATFNINLRNPSTRIYPKKEPSDAPYSVSETQLRAAMQIPKTFTYGQKTPVLFVPGTTSYGGESYKNNLGKLLTGKPYADPVWLNVPGAFLGDAQVNAEYVAYAINYLSGITGRKVSVVGWSQGGLSTQWALTFWPSTRAQVEDFLAVSPDFHGDILAKVFCLTGPTILDDEGQPAFDLNLIPCPPAVTQQDYDSAFVTKLRSRGGADAYVPTTSFWTVTDEIVQPQIGNLSSAYMGDARGVGVTNVEIQSVCPGQPAGGLYGHIDLLANPLVAALVVDALQHPGPADISRIDLKEVCKQVIPPGLTVGDFIATAGLIINCGFRLFGYLPKLYVEPRLKDYAI